MSVLQIKNILVKYWKKKLLNGIDIDIQQWNNYAILWKNWSWKSTLLLSIMWHPQYNISNWDVLLDWVSIKDYTPDQRAKKGMFLAFQNIPEIKWVKLFDFLKTVYNSHLPDWSQPIRFIKFKQLILPFLDEIWLDKEFLFRDLNVWFSWWEKRKVEILLMKLIKPKYIFLDEIDSWLDINALKSLWEMLKQLDWPNNTIIIVSHYFDIFKYVNINRTFVFEQWEITQSWWEELIDKIKDKGF